jgi:Icc protein
VKHVLRIAQVTDCHLPASPELQYRGVNAYENLQRVLQKVAKFSPDLLLASGDLSEDASAASYSALKDYFDLLNVPVLALPGNHDDPGLLAQLFPGSPETSISVSEHGAWQIIRINSCIEKRPEGRLTTACLDQLAEALEQNPMRPRLVVLHHQPMLVDSPWIDKYRLQDPQAFLDIVASAPAVKAVLWGHVHRVFETQWRGIKMMSGPSSAINSLAGVDKFTADPKGPAFRWLCLGAEGSVESGVTYL